MRKRLTKKKEAQEKKDWEKLIKTANDLRGIWANLPKSVKRELMKKSYL